MTYNDKPVYCLCDEHDEVTPVDDFGIPIGYGGYCPRCGRAVLPYYKCPGCGEEKPEYEFMLDDIDLCKSCFSKVLEEMSKELDSPRKRQIYEFLRGCS